MAAKPPKPNKLPLTIVVSGTPFGIEGNLNAPLRALVEKTLEETKNTGRPIEDWQLTDEAGHELDLDRKLETYGFQPGAVLILSLKAGVLG